jgi:hypothetical protein
VRDSSPHGRNRRSAICDSSVGRNKIVELVGLWWPNLGHCLEAPPLVGSKLSRSPTFEAKRS